MKKIILIAMLVALASAATMTTYRTAFSVEPPGPCAINDNNNGQGDDDCQ